MTYVTGLIGGFFTAYANYVEGETAARVAKRNARIAQYNAAIARQSAEYEAREAEHQGLLAREAALVREENVRREGERVQHAGRQTAAAGGLVPSEGSPLLVEIQNVRETEIAALRERYTGERILEIAQRDAQKLRYQGELRARDFENEAYLLKLGVRVQRDLAPARAIGTFLSGGGGAGVSTLLTQSRGSGSAPAAAGATSTSASTTDLSGGGYR